MAMKRILPIVFVLVSLIVMASGCIFKVRTSGDTSQPFSLSVRSHPGSGVVKGWDAVLLRPDVSAVLHNPGREVTYGKSQVLVFLKVSSDVANLSAPYLGNDTYLVPPWAFHRFGNRMQATLTLTLKNGTPGDVEVSYRGLPGKTANPIVNLDIIKLNESAYKVLLSFNQPTFSVLGESFRVLPKPINGTVSFHGLPSVKVVQPGVYIVPAENTFTRGAAVLSVSVNLLELYVSRDDYKVFVETVGFPYDKLGG